jgi:hypothetical protein
MTFTGRPVLIVHAKDEEHQADRLARPLIASGYTVAHRGTVLVGQSLVGEMARNLDAQIPVIFCGTIKAVGTHWGRKIVQAARERGLPVLIVQMDEEAAVDSLSLGEKVADYWRDPDNAVADLLTALRVYYPSPVADTGESDRSIPQAFERDDYEKRYRNTVCTRFNEMELFGVTSLTDEAKTHDLSIAYVSLNLETDLEEGQASSLLFETILDRFHLESGRLLIRGEAGSGKTTLLKWVAVEASGTRPSDKEWSHRGRGEEETGRAGTGDSRHWRNRLPLLVRLRDCGGGRLPPLDEIHLTIAPELGTPPRGWAVSLLASGRALVLLDGIDEIPTAERDDLRRDVKALVTAYPKNLFILTTRPAAVKPSWLAELEFAVARINPMSDTDRDRFIRRWHHAVGERYRRLYNQDDPKVGLAEELSQTLDNTPAIKRLATNPLLCAMICALHRDLDKKLPGSQSELCDELVKLLLERRDQSIRNRAAPALYAALDYTRKRTLVRHLAHHMVFNETSSLAFDIAEIKIAEVLADYPTSVTISTAEAATLVRQALLERSGLLREVQHGRLDFLHNTFKEYLAAEAFVSNLDVGYFLNRALDPSFQPVVLFAAQYDNPRFIADLIDGLLPSDKGGSTSRSAKSQAKLILAIQCRFLGLRVPQQTQQRVDRLVETVFPPRKLADAESLANCGDLVVHLLDPRPTHSPVQAAACVRALRLIGSRSAREVLDGYLADRRTDVVSELVQAVNPLKIGAILDLILEGEAASEAVAKQIIDLKPLRDLPGVQTLNLSRTWAIDLSPLSGLSGLRSLDLSRTSVTDLGPLSGLSELRVLNLRHTPLTDFRPLSSLSGLQSLSLARTSVTDLSPLSGLSGLQSLSLTRTSVTDLGPLSSLSKLQILDLSYSSVTDLGPLSALSGLQSLNLSSTEVKGLNPLSGLSGLQSLDLSSLRITDLGWLSGLSMLNGLNLRHTAVRDLRPLSGLSMLQTLYLADTPVSDIGPLSRLTGLRSLDLSATWVTDLGPLSGLSGLRSLDLSHSKITYISSLSGLSGLQTLDLSYTSVTDLSPLTRLKSLQKVWVTNAAKVKIPKGLPREKINSRINSS